MTVQPPGPPAHTPPPPVADRRAPERRADTPRRAEDRAQLARTAVVAATSICGGLAALFLFFWAIGAVDVKNAAAATIAAIVMACVWVAGFMYRRRHESAVVQQHERERRGF